MERVEQGAFTSMAVLYFQQLLFEPKKQWELPRSFQVQKYVSCQKHPVLLRQLQTLQGGKKQINHLTKDWTWSLASADKESITRILFFSASWECNVVRTYIHTYQLLQRASIVSSTCSSHNSKFGQIWLFLTTATGLACYFSNGTIQMLNTWG